MFKRNSISKVAFTVFVFTMLCLLPSVATAQVPGEPQQGINTSRSNIKNTSRTAEPLDTLNLLIRRQSGERIASSTVADSNNDGKLSEDESAFDFGVLPVGDYVLTVIRLNEKIDAVKTDLSGRISITGAVGGKIEKEWKLATNKAADASRENQRVGDLSSQVNALSIPLKADGKTSIAGKITLPNGGVVIKNIKRPN